MPTLITAALTAENTFSDAIGKSAERTDPLAINITGTWAGTVTVQRSLDGGTTWGDYATTYTANVQVDITPVLGVQYRVGCKTGNFTSGTIDIQIL